MAGPNPDLGNFLGNMGHETSRLVGNDGLIPDLDYKASVMDRARDTYDIAQTSMGNPSSSTAVNSLFGTGGGKDKDSSYRRTSEKLAAQRTESAKAAEASASANSGEQHVTPFTGHYVSGG